MVRLPWRHERGNKNRMCERKRKLRQYLTLAMVVSFLLWFGNGSVESSSPARANPPSAHEIEIRAKVGQLFMLAFSGTNPDEVVFLVRERGIGGLYLSNENLPDAARSARLLNSLQH